jgi:hypothetical protein
MAEIPGRNYSDVANCHHTPETFEIAKQQMITPGGILPRLDQSNIAIERRRGRALAWIASKEFCEIIPVQLLRIPTIKICP